MDSKEGKVIGRTSHPATKASLVQDFSVLGVKQGMTLLVHSSLSSLGWVSGGAAAVILALLEAIGPEGTLVMPTHSGDLSDPKEWRNPPVPEAWWPVIYESMPAFRADLTPTRGMGMVSETFRGMTGVLRSNHPQLSFAAYGPNAEQITTGHSLSSGMGEESPLARVYDLDGWVLLLGVGHGNNTSLHLAETRADFPGKKTIKNGAPVMVDGARQWVVLEDLAYNEEDFPEIGKAFGKDTKQEITGRVGEGEARLMPQRALVDFAVGWMETNRK
jgi:aminoglycoside 3-N-acetyltransferase